MLGVFLNCRLTDLAERKQDPQGEEGGFEDLAYQRDSSPYFKSSKRHALIRWSKAEHNM